MVTLSSIFRILPVNPALKTRNILTHRREQQKYVKPLLPYEIFMANIEAGSDKQLIIRDLAESYGLKISSKCAPGHICAVATLESIHDRYGYHVLDRVLRLMIDTWEGVPQSLSANMLNGLARLVYAYADALKENMFKDKLSAISIKEIDQETIQADLDDVGDDISVENGEQMNIFSDSDA